MKPTVTIDLNEYNALKRIENGFLQNKMVIVLTTTYSGLTESMTVYNPDDTIAKVVDEIISLRNQVNNHKKKWWQL